MIVLQVATKIFEGAYNTIENFKKLGLGPITQTYNVVLKKHLQRNVPAETVLMKMENDNLLPNGRTFLLRICHCTSAKDLFEMYEQVKE